MPVVEQLDSVTIERLKKQARFLQGIHQAEFDKDPSSRATEFARSNVIALRHTVSQVYGEAVARYLGKHRSAVYFRAGTLLTSET
jgi:hypothetical protein